MENGYRKLLSAFMRVRWMAWLVVIACFGIIYLIGSQLQSELAPMEDKSNFRLLVTAPEGTAYDAMDQYMGKLSTFLMDSVPEKRYVVSMTAPGFTGNGASNSGFIRVALVEPAQRQRSQQDIVNWVNKNAQRFNQGRVFAVQDQTIQVNRRSSQPVQFVLQNVDADKLRKALPKILEAANKSNVLTGVDADLKFNKPELRINVDRLKASELGVSVNDISQTLQLALSNQRLGYFTKEGKQYSVIGQVDRINRDDPSDLDKLYVSNNQGQSIPLSNLLQVTEDVTPPTLYHFNRYRSATISAGLAEGKTIGDGIKEIQAIADSVLDESFHTALSGSSRDYAESSSNTLFAFFLALGLIFLVLAAQFESFIDPFVILLAVPLSMVGALTALNLVGGTLNVYSQIGLITLVGLISKHGILIVEFSNQLRQQGQGLTEAVLNAASQRLRPILMTTGAMVLGALPLALASGAGAESRQQIGWVIVGGMSVGTLLTIFVVPTVYTLFARRQVPGEITTPEADGPVPAAHAGAD
jgi:multidrug efflux pump subunit AcrB